MSATPFGKYTLLEKIGMGGMAELFLAKQEGMEGFEKILAIKRILPHLTQDSEFVNMFINEAKLAALLTHQNIVQIYDLGSAVPMGLSEPSYYIAMEYIKGKDIRNMVNSLRKKRTIFPIDHAISIMNKVCYGLDYAHRKKDSQGNDLRIVHRDISPQNILVSYEGEVKVVDFGIAKAASQGSETRTGLLKGKLAYMSPEQAWGKTVDRRTDIFAMGIVLYEILTGERLFKGENEISTLEKVREAKVPPAPFFNPQIDQELNHILLKALAKDPSDRFQTASEMAISLETIISKKGYSFSSLSLSNYMRHLFEQDVEEETKRIQWATHTQKSALEQTVRKEENFPMKSGSMPPSQGQPPFPSNEPMGSVSSPLQKKVSPIPGGPATPPFSYGQSKAPIENKDQGLAHRKPQSKPRLKPRPSHTSVPLSAHRNKKSHPILKSLFLCLIILFLSGYLSLLYHPNLLIQASNHFPWVEKAQKKIYNITASFFGDRNNTVTSSLPEKKPRIQPSPPVDEISLSPLNMVALTSAPSPERPEASSYQTLSSPIIPMEEGFSPQNPTQIKDQKSRSPFSSTPNPSSEKTHKEEFPSKNQSRQFGKIPGTPPSKQPPSQPRVSELFREVKLAYHQGNLDTMERKLRQIIELTPNSSKAYHLLGTVYLNRNDKETALRIFSEAVSTFPNDPLLHYDLGFLYNEKNLFSLARDEFSKAIALAPNAPRAHRARLVLQEIGENP